MTRQSFKGNGSSVVKSDLEAQYHVYSVRSCTLIRGADAADLTLALFICRLRSLSRCNLQMKDRTSKGGIRRLIQLSLTRDRDRATLTITSHRPLLASTDSDDPQGASATKGSYKDLFPLESPPPRPISHRKIVEGQSHSSFSLCRRLYRLLSVHFLWKRASQLQLACQLLLLER